MSERKYTWGLLKEQEELRYRCWDLRMNVADAATLCGCSIQALYEWYYKRGMYPDDDHGIIRKNGIHPDEGKEIIRMYREGMSVREVAKIAGYSRSAVSGYLRRRGELKRCRD